MEAQINPQEMMAMIIELKARVDKLQEEFEDTQLSEDDLEALRIADEEFEKGKTFSWEDIEKERTENGLD